MFQDISNFKNNHIILSRLLGNVANILWVLDLTLDLLGIHQAELYLIITCNLTVTITLRNSEQ
jgi:hypothetical protein